MSKHRVALNGLEPPGRRIARSRCATGFAKPRASGAPEAAPRAKELARMRAFEREIRELRLANEILKSAVVSSTGESNAA